MSNDFVDRTVLVTGAARGLGLAITGEFHSRGASVFMNDLTGSDIADAIEQLGGGPRLFGAPADISTVDGCSDAVNGAVEHFGRLDVLVNNAGINIEKPVDEWDELLWDRHVDLILKGPFFCVKEALPQLRRNRGNVVNISSNLGIHAVRDNPGYCAAKGGLLNLTRALAMDLAPDVRVNCLCPGVMNTELMRQCAEDSGEPASYYENYEAYAPLKRLSEPAEMAKSVAFMASDDAAFMTGAVLAVDGGGTAGYTVS